MLPARSVIIWSILQLLCPDFNRASWRAPAEIRLGCLCPRDGAAGLKLFDLGRVEPELPEDLVIVLAEAGRAACRLLFNAMHLHGAADRQRQLAFRALEGNDDVVGAQLRVVD